MAPVIPTVFSRNKREFMKRFRNVLPVSDRVQVDFMDGKFVKGRSVRAGVLPDLRAYRRKYGVSCEAHLMVAQPLRWVARLQKRGFTRAIFHVEAVTEQQGRLMIKRLRAAQMEPMIAINPSTSISRLDPFLDEVVGVLFLGVNPGKEGQKLVPNVYDKIRSYKRHHPRTFVQVDGGVNHTNAMRLVLAGADALNSGSYISASLDPASAKASLEREAKRGLRERRMLKR